MTLEHELNAWLDAHWDPTLTVAEWWERLGTAGWAAPTLPSHAYGRGLDAGTAGRVAAAIADAGALGPPSGLGLLLAAPTIATYGTEEQIERFVRPIVTGRTAWCQLFSEPAAGSDLAGLRTRAVEDGDGWRIEGQKVWTSEGHLADHGMLLARTDWDAPKHQGITWFALDLDQPGVEVRPLREMTGKAIFSEVFLDGAHVSVDDVIGGLGNGWAVANTTLGFERASLGVGARGIGGGADPGRISGHLAWSVTDALAYTNPDVGEDMIELTRTAVSRLAEVARHRGVDRDPRIRARLAELHTLQEVGRMHLWRASRSASPIPGLANVSKLILSDVVRRTRDTALSLLGGYGTLQIPYGAQGVWPGFEAGTATAAAYVNLALLSPAPSIYGGSDEIQRNVLAERILGLPREPGPDRATPFSLLPPNG